MCTMHGTRRGNKHVNICGSCVTCLRGGLVAGDSVSLLKRRIARIADDQLGTYWEHVLTGHFSGRGTGRRGEMEAMVIKRPEHLGKLQTICLVAWFVCVQALTGTEGKKRGWSDGGVTDCVWSRTSVFRVVCSWVCLHGSFDCAFGIKFFFMHTWRSFLLAQAVSTRLAFFASGSPVFRPSLELP